MRRYEGVPGPAIFGAMRIDPATGLLDGARQLPSPNCDLRPPGAEIDVIVIHGISLPPGEFGGPWIDALFTNRLDPEAHPYFREICDLKVSAHFLIRRDGEIAQYVPVTERAWHAGNSSFDGRPDCNDFSVGIELEGADDQPYEDVQYERLAAAVQAVKALFPAIGDECIVGHCDVAPGRKTDPGPAFDWQHLYRLLGP